MPRLQSNPSQGWPRGFDQFFFQGRRRPGRGTGSGTVSAEAPLGFPSTYQLSVRQTVYFTQFHCPRLPSSRFGASHRGNSEADCPWVSRQVAPAQAPEDSVIPPRQTEAWWRLSWLRLLWLRGTLNTAAQVLRAPCCRGSGSVHRALAGLALPHWWPVLVACGVAGGRAGSDGVHR